MIDPIVIVNAKRTPHGAFQGKLSHLSATEIGSCVIKAIVQENKIIAEKIDNVILGCVLSAGLGQAPARQAALNGNLAQSVSCLTINKVCGSGLEAVILGQSLIKSGDASIVIAGGMESMSNSPYLNLKARKGCRIGHQSLLDHMLHDGLQDSFSNGTLMGLLAEKTAQKYNFSREAQDQFALRSVHKAFKARDTKTFIDEIVPIKIQTAKQEYILQDDETLEKIDPKKIVKLKPAFLNNGTITAANASSISDGAAGLLLMKKSYAQKLKLNILCTIKAVASYSQAPQEFTTAPVGAIKKLIQKTQWTMDEVDLFEINEAFAVVTMACLNELQIPESKVNINGGACALGHPIGASGARILVSLIHAMNKHKRKKGIASLCIGGGEAVAMAIER